MPNADTGPNTPASSVSCSGLSFRWPDGTEVFDGLSLTIGRGRTGLVGANGSGKSTLLGLLAGRLRPSQGSVTVGGGLAHLPQDITLDTALRVEEALGIAERRRALRAIEAGEVSDEHFETVGDDWLSPDWFRFGASSLLNDLLMQRTKLTTGHYAGPDYFTLD